MPEPSEGESKEDFVKRCIPVVLDDGSAENNDQAVAMCYSMWEQSKKKSYQVKVIDIDDDHAKVGGYGVIFGGVDLEGETFTSETDFMPDLVPVKLVLYDHGLQKTVRHTLGKAKEKIDEVGIWVEAQLDRHKDYVSEILQLIDEGILGWSSGSVGHLVERDGKTIKRWPIVEYSLTPTPAEPRTIGVERIKQLAEANPDLKALIPEGAGDVPDDATVTIADATQINVISMEDKKMADEKEKEVVEQPIEVKEIDHPDEVKTDNLKHVSAQVEELTDKMNQMMKFMEDTPAIRKSGYFTVDGGNADQTVKSFGDFLKAIHRGDRKRLTEVYGAKTAMAEGSGATGGFLVPEEFMNRLLQIAGEQAVVRPRAVTFNVGSDAGRIPALDQATAPTAGVGQTALAGGVRAYWTAEAGAITETEPGFKEIEYNIKKMAGYSLVSNELISDSAQGIETILYTMFGRAVAAMEDYAFLRGNGANEPLGVLNWGGAIGITPSTNSTFGFIDAQSMLSRFYPVGGSPIWAMHRGVIPDLADFTSYVGALFEPRERMYQSIYGYPIVFSEHLPQDDNSGDVILADFGAYAIFDRQGLAIAFSEHYKFVNDQGTWRFTKRLDGMPWMNSYITLADPQGSYTVSPIVYHND